MLLNIKERRIIILWMQWPILYNKHKKVRKYLRMKLKQAFKKAVCERVFV